ncbi:MAG: efflux RND transporter periplasmic adaptor subunit, partial [Muribaculaceae bacterium]|nr:efflux RND transporter periplasmic adaptor subunit [Muribaculaceae bacterium]
IVGRVNGTLQSKSYTDGDKVKKGQVLFQIESTEYRDAVAQAEATLSTARSQYEYASKNYAAMTKALESDAVSQIEVLQAKNSMETARASVKNAEAALQTARTNLGYCTVRAPFDGTMSKSAFSLGTYISGAGSPVTLATIYDNSQLHANFSIDDAKYIRNIIEGTTEKLVDYERVPVKFTDQMPHQYTGKLNYVAPDVNTSTGTIQLRLVIDNPYGELVDGMYTTIDLPYQVDPHAILVKDAAITTSQTKKFLYVVNDSDKVEYVPIEVGEMANDSMRIVTSGLKGNEKYVTKALLKVRPGMKVDPKIVK